MWKANFNYRQTWHELGSSGRQAVEMAVEDTSRGVQPPEGWLNKHSGERARARRPRVAACPLASPRASPAGQR